jgi:RteC protein
MNISRTINLFNKIRKNELGVNDYDLELKEISDNFNKENLRFILNDLQQYIAKEAIKNIKTGKTISIIAPISNNKKPKAFTLDYSALKTPDEFKRLIVFQKYLIEKEVSIRQGLIDHEDMLVTEKPENKMIFYETVKWEGTSLELSELVKSLIQSKILNTNLSQKEIFNRVRKMFEMDDFNENEKLRDIRNRINTKTPLLFKLENSLNNWIKSKD